jgi:hypothetical protein
MFLGGSLNQKAHTTQIVMKERKHWRLGALVCSTLAWRFSALALMAILLSRLASFSIVQRDEMRNWRAIFSTKLLLDFEGFYWISDVRFGLDYVYGYHNNEFI